MKNLAHLKDLAYRAFSGTSFNPEKRGETFIKEHESELKSDLEKLPEEVKERDAERYIALCYDYLLSHSRVYSSMITGPSNFPVDRMRKLNGYADNKYAAVQDFRERFMKSVERSQKKTEIAEQGGELAVTRKKLEEQEMVHQQMKDANKIIGGKYAEAEKVSRLMELGISQEDAIRALDPEGYGFINGISFWKGRGFGLTNSNARIKHTKSRIDLMERRENTPIKESETNGIKIVENAKANRLQIFFPGKPNDETKGKLKSLGFHWTPSVGCWQAYLNNNSRYKAELIIKSL